MASSEMKLRDLKENEDTLTHWPLQNVNNILNK